MTVQRAFRLLVGIMVLVSVLLARFHSAHWLWLTAFIGLNLIQSAFTGFCPPLALLRKLGLPSHEDTTLNGE